MKPHRRGRSGRNGRVVLGLRGQLAIRYGANDFFHYREEATDGHIFRAARRLG